MSPPAIDRLPPALRDGLALPLIAAPLFLVSGVDLVVAACENGVIGSFPSLNARSPDVLDRWMGEIGHRLDAARAAGKRPAAWAVNIVAHPTNQRLKPDLELCAKHKCPLIITSLGGPRTVVDAVHAYGGLVYSDVINVEFAKKAAAAGVDGLVLVCSGAGGHFGPMAAPAFAAAVREFWPGHLVLAGALSHGRDIRAMQALGADLVYMGTRFIATTESLAEADYKKMIVESGFADLFQTNVVTGAWANFLRPSFLRMGLDPDNLGPARKFTAEKAESDAKRWKNLWSAGQGVGEVKAVESVAAVVAALKREYDEALRAERADGWAERRGVA